MRASHPDKCERLREIEAQARSIRQYAGCSVPGLLQTPDCVRTG
ncbi:Scr1 family TA system antitoxin-like transcriptional regulator [Streptomyces morookaense]|nr:Scr1 family TA system antitoxin-like transcriptional regulator [Streptomyces morookaense]